MRRYEELEKVILPIVSGFGYTWVGLQYFPQGKRSILRLYIDKPGGITLDDCERVSRQVDAVLNVENTIKGDFTLEVSSPGIDRILFTAAQCEEYIGKDISVRMNVPIEGRRNFKGKLQSVQNDRLCILSEGKEITLSFIDISEARLVPEW
jgi:ribosome maturation factor RimP